MNFLFILLIFLYIQISSDASNAIEALDFHSPYDLIDQLQQVIFADMATQQIKDKKDFIDNVISIFSYEETQIGYQCRNLQKDFSDILPKITLTQDGKQVQNTKFPLAGNNNILFNQEIYKIVSNKIFDSSQRILIKISQLFQNLYKINSEYYDKNQDLYYEKVHDRIFQQAESNGKQNQLSYYDTLNIDSKELGIDQINNIIRCSIIKIFINCLLCALQFIDHPYQLLLTQTFRQIQIKEQRQNKDGKKYLVDMYKITEIFNTPLDDETLDNCFFTVLLKGITEYVIYDDQTNPDCTQEIYQLLCIFMSKIYYIRDDLVQYLNICKTDQQIIQKFKEQTEEYINQILDRSRVYFNYAYQNVILKDDGEYYVQPIQEGLVQQFIDDQSVRNEMLLQIANNIIDKHQYTQSILQVFNIDQESFIQTVLDRFINQNKIQCIIPLISCEQNYQPGFDIRYLRSALEYLLELRKQNKDKCQNVFKKHQQRLQDRKIKEQIYQYFIQCIRLLELNRQDLNTEFFILVFNKIIKYVIKDESIKFTDDIIQDIRYYANYIDLIPQSVYTQMKIKIYNQACNLSHIYNLLQDIDDQIENYIIIEQQYPLIQQFYCGVNQKYINNQDIINASYLLNQCNNKNLYVVDQMIKDKNWFIKKSNNSHELIYNEITQEIKNELTDYEQYITAWVKIQKDDDEFIKNRQDEYRLQDIAKVKQSDRYWRLSSQWVIGHQNDVIYIIITKSTLPIQKLESNQIPYIDEEEPYIIYYVNEEGQQQEYNVKIINNFIKNNSFEFQENTIKQQDNNDEEIQFDEQKQQYTNQQVLTYDQLLCHIKNRKGIRLATTYFKNKQNIHQNTYLYKIDKIDKNIIEWSQQQQQKLFVFCQEENKTIGQSLYDRFTQLNQELDKDIKTQLLDNDQEQIKLALQHFNIIILKQNIELNVKEQFYLNINEDEYILFSK